jgi:hypothetical protein
MSTITVSAMSPLPAVNATYTYGITGSSTEGKIAVNATDGLAAFNGNGLMSSADGLSTVGTDAKRFSVINLSGTGALVWNDGTGNGSAMSYAAAVGPTFYDVTANFTLSVNLQSLTADRTLTAPDASGVITALGNATSGTGAFALVASPTFTGTVTAAAVSASSDVKVTVAGKGLFVKEGSNAKMGTAVLSSGTAVVSTTAVTATSRIFLTAQSLGTVSVGQGTCGERTHGRDVVYDPVWQRDRYQHSGVAHHRAGVIPWPCPRLTLRIWR